uniref:Zinc finger protein ZPR1 homolog n=1 Tax=Dermatophagoides pteronyssinus TaxID=6956 RepID=A0A6P6XKZ2_DERPT|nr:zinc finger protein ZPR1 homolog [Dermatophagoides pteronyssinus]
MMEIDIPGFRKCLIMSFLCDHCGYKSNEVKPTAQYGDKGAKWTLNVTCIEDLSRDILKSDSASISLPSLELDLEPGTLGGVFTTIEGLLVRIHDEIIDKFKLILGDSKDEKNKQILLFVLQQLKGHLEGTSLPFTLILDDCADLSHIGSIGDELLFFSNPGKPNEQKTKKDANLTKEFYERNEDQNIFLGIADMKVEDY